MFEFEFLQVIIEINDCSEQQSKFPRTMVVKDILSIRVTG